jgi:uncharacterized protein YycO
MSAPVTVHVCLHRGSSVVSRLIRWQTRSEYSHASLLLPGGHHYEAREGRGVLRHAGFTLTNPTEQVDAFAVDLTPTQFDDLRHFLGAQVGKPYDWLMVARFVSRRQESRGTSGKWFCSELVYAALQQAGVPLFRATEPWEVAPGLLARSPLLRPDPSALRP